MSYSNAPPGRKKEEMRYLIALGSNQRHVRFGSSGKILHRALEVMAGTDIHIAKRSAVFSSRPLGPSRRQFANMTAIVETRLSPLALMQFLQKLEAEFGARRGQLWSSRALDLDIIFWSEGAFHSDVPDLTIPHPLFRERSFVLGPATQIAGGWRDPVTGLTIRQIRARLKQNGNRPAKG